VSTRSSQAAFLDELAALYREVDALYEGWSCPGSTECCRFGITGRQPYVTSIEVAAIETALRARGSDGPLPKHKRALPLTSDAGRERVCALLDRNGKCSVYAARPFGCRTFYCERATPGPGPERDELRDLVRKLQELAARHQLGGELSRPLMRVFGET
jgi:Fe-S-cluster containining protein